ncbi:MAG: arsenic efflux protein [Bacilli bacterium]|nr:arsenic efflux protein [Bacilli bacterium]
MHELIHCLIHTIEEVLLLIPFLFIAFFIIEVIEHKLSSKSKKIIEKSGRLGPLFGGLLGMIPQCGFSVVATNLYITRIVSLGTLIAIYLSTSDEMLPILISRKASINTILGLLFIKFIIGMIAGFIIDFFIRRYKKKHKIKIKENFDICHDEDCHCEKENLFVSSLKHTFKTVSFIFIVTFLLHIMMEYLGEDVIKKLFLKDNLFSPFISSLVGLIPNCAASVALTELYLSGVISTSSVIAGLLTGSGVAILVLFRGNKNLKENLFILGLVYFIGAFSGLIIGIIEMLL